MENEDSIHRRYLDVRDHLDGRARRLFVAAEAKESGIACVSRATGMAESTIGRGLKDLKDPDSLTGDVRRKGAGRS